MIESPLLVAIGGPTGVGKSDVALALAQATGGEIVNYDSVQIYRGFDIGSAKPSAESRALVPHHLFDIVDAGEPFNAASYAERANRVIDEIASRRALPLLVGGTGFYLRALLSGLPEMPPANDELRRRIRRIAESRSGPRRLHRWLLKIDPLTAARVAPADRHRVERALEVWTASGRPISSWQRPTGETPRTRRARIFVLTLLREELVTALDRRIERMYADGLIEETRRLLLHYPLHAQPFGSIGYREAVRVLQNEITTEEAIAETRRRTRAYAKRQMTWWRAERDVTPIDMSAGVDHAAALILQSLRDVPPS